MKDQLVHNRRSSLEDSSYTSRVCMAQGTLLLILCTLYLVVIIKAVDDSDSRQSLGLDICEELFLCPNR